MTPSRNGSGQKAGALSTLGATAAAAVERVGPDDEPHTALGADADTDAAPTVAADEGAPVVLETAREPFAPPPDDVYPELLEEEDAEAGAELQLLGGTLGSTSSLSSLRNCNATARSCLKCRGHKREYGKMRRQIQ